MCSMLCSLDLITGCMLDIFGIIFIVQKEGMEFWDDMNDWSPLSWDLPVKARKLEVHFSRQWAYTKRCCGMSPRRWVARSSPRNGCLTVVADW